jgi:Tol biopolymer transport system component/predicted Ser/Thr protein kinase
MPHSAGDKLGPYEILAPIGAGGMGEVYKARDTRLGRDVAIKIASEKFSDRFEREARSIAALNHPNICQLYDVGPNYLVMELIDGESPKGPMPLDQALKLAHQIAAALEAAHERGIVHRDLKPANILITSAGTIKVLDFGLAKNTEAPASDPENSPTMTVSPTSVGMIVGTAAYMAPEQARGKPVDRRADIWAFGVVVYEMLTGEHLFHGETTTDILASVVKEEPDLNRVPAKIRRLLQACLRKDPKRRLQAIGDWALLLDDAPPDPPRPGRTPLVLGATLGAGVMLAGLALAALLWRSKVAAEGPFMRFDVDLGSDISLGSGEGPPLAISPDGARLAFLTRGPDNRDHLALRLLGNSAATVLAGTDGAVNPFFSPDGRWVAFFADRKLKKISVEGGEPVTLCDAPSPRGGAWGPDGTILFAPQTRVALLRVSSSGGAAQPATQLDASKGEITHRLPQFLPDGDTFLFLTRGTNDSYEDSTIVAQSLKTGKRSILFKGGYAPHYLPTAADSGHLVYMHEGTLFAAPMDPKRLKLTGPAAPVIEDVAGWQESSNGFAEFDVSPAGTFVYLRADLKETISIIDRSGSRQKLALPPDSYWNVSVSPDGTRLALAAKPDRASTTVSVYELASGAIFRLASLKGQAISWAWTPDAKHLAFSLEGPSGPGVYGPGVYWMRADAPSDPVRLQEGTGWMPHSFSPDGTKLASGRRSPPFGIWIFPLDFADPEHPKAGPPQTLLQDSLEARLPAFSPDGRWIGYSLVEPGELRQIFVQPYPGPGGRIRISRQGSGRIWWSHSSHELLFLEPTGRNWAAEYTDLAGSFRVGEPKPWSAATPSITGRVDFMPDGKRAIVMTPADERPPSHATFLLNFFDEVRRRAPEVK